MKLRCFLTLIVCLSSAATVSAQLTNLSARTTVGTGDEEVEITFTLTAASAQNVLIRGVGPTLGLFGVPGTIADPNIELYQNGGLLESNDNWDDTNGDAISVFSATVGAFGLTGGAADSAILTSLTAGTYTVRFFGEGATTGTGLGEVYVSGGAGESFSYLSYQTVVSGASVGFASTNSDQNTMIRLLGPELGAGGAVDPSISLLQGATELDSNDDWEDADASLISGYSNSLGLDDLDPGSLDSALISELDAGVYTISATGGSGIGLFEIANLTGVSAVPEPSTYATIMGILVLGLVTRRRRGHRS